jgi:hypothetical protein
MGAVATRPADQDTPRLVTPDDEYARWRRSQMRERLVTAGVPLIERDDGNPLVTGRDIFSDIAAEIERYLRGLTIPQLVCLAYGHSWPMLIPGLAVPRGFRALPEPGRPGIYRMTEACTRNTSGSSSRRSAVHCGTVRTSMTLDRGIGLDRGRSRNYAYDDDAWEIRPVGSRLTRVDFLNEIMRRMGRELFPGEFEGTA